MKGGGVFRGMMKGLRERATGVRKVEIPDPVISQTQHQRSHKSTKRNRQGRKRLPMPSCDPGTITYFDRLVRYCAYDRRRADQMMREWRDSEGAVSLPDLRGR